jgi:hypothetical protein
MSGRTGGGIDAYLSLKVGLYELSGLVHYKRKGGATLQRKLHILGMSTLLDRCLTNMISQMYTFHCGKHAIWLLFSR